ncbi:hypothetical protein IMZ48_47505, partial [Candidatus Bathyarchaeota archaeon]|nr:hypothetical protein [Candidatus Bathyarchaeota archaeon]
MDADIIIASPAAVKFRCFMSSAPSLRLAQVSGEPRMSGPDNSRNYRDFYSKCCTAMRKIAEDVARNPQYDVAAEIARRAAENNRVLRAAASRYVPPSGRPKKGAPKKKTAKAPGTQQASSTQSAADDSDDGRPAKVTKTAGGQSAPNAMSGVVSSNGASTAAGASTKKRKTATATATKTKTAEPPESYYVENAKRFLESYTFTRVILDEYSFKDHEVETFVERAIASSKWLLSGTPPLTKLSLVCRTASMLNVHVARIEPAFPSHLHDITEGPSAADMSASEAYRALRQLLTTTFAHERHQQGLNFVSLFARRNPAVLSGFKVVEKVVFVSRDTPVIAHGFRLQQCLYAARWDVQGLSHDGNELLKVVIQLGKSDEPEDSKKTKAMKSWMQENSTDGRLDAAIQALLMHATLPSKGFHAKDAAKTPGMTISDSLGLLRQDAELEYRRLGSTLKSQYDRLDWLVAQFPEMEIKASSSEDEEPDEDEPDNGDEAGDSAASGSGEGTDSAEEGIESAEDEASDPAGDEAEEPEEQGGPNSAAPTDGKKFKSKEARDRKFRQASRYLELLVDAIKNQKEKSLGGREILNLLSTIIFAGSEQDPHEAGQGSAGAPWQRRTNVPETSYLVDWYPDVAQRLPSMSDEELKLVYLDCADLLEKRNLPDFDTMGIAKRRLLTTAIISEAQVRRREQFVNDDVEKRSGLAGGPTDLSPINLLTPDLLTHRMRARKIGLKCLSHDTLETLQDRYSQHRRGRCPDKFWEFALGLTSRFPIKGMARHLRGTDVEEGLEDLTWTSQSVTAGAYEKIPEAFHRYRFLLTVSSLAQEVLDGRLCDGCGRTGVPSDQVRLTVGCSHAFCNTCAEKNTATAGDEFSWCRLCRGNGEPRTMLPLRPEPGLFCHDCKLIEIKKPIDGYVLATCGHLMCKGCIYNLYAKPSIKIDGSPDLPRCKVQNCNYPLLENEIRGDKLITREGNVPIDSLGPGGKLQKMIEIVNAAKRNGERVLVFVPYKEQMGSIHRCLLDAGISVARTDGGLCPMDSLDTPKKGGVGPINSLCTLKKGGVGLIDPLETFKKGGVQVLLQLLNSPESAGSNLTIANHIIFVG